ncbi:AMP-binding protein [Gilvimarinus sp. SDUM040013]|uniref:Long-chain-fatty-acid--CoA ligase n=1 Tax=Gilvimarinus gilvus TaxID=3058038 RepID=A0ABU4RWB1_9GAMM|nr:AMP-binding protein [Gilvimarinus sp. SDUM040013]MDO3386590.1 AMP-binding protein [Gilvimarinus sp. SDUM040013]MDX6849166.1 AMP-binding protein [Gilvimarinus sp. SDUM040013]
MSLDSNRMIVDVFAEACRDYADSPAFTCINHTISFRELDELSARFASYLQNHTNLKPGDRIAIQLPNVLQYPVAVFGALRAGLVVVNTNPLYTATELKHQLTDSGAKALVVLANVAGHASEVVAETDVEQVILTELADLHPPLKRTLINFVVKHIKKMVPAFSFNNSIPFNKALASGATRPWQPVSGIPDDVAVLQYTGGTTGVAKGAMLTHRNLVANMLQVNLHMNDVFKKNQDLFVAPLPLYHIYAYTIHCMCALSLGNHNLLIPNPRDIPGFVKALKGVPFTCFVGLNTLFNALIRNTDFRALDFSNLRCTSSGGMALTHDAAKRWEELTGVPVSEGYGLTETSPVVCINPRFSIKLGTVGVALPETEVKVISEDGESLPVGEAGELCVRGPQVMKGYWQRPEATREILDDEGWLKTGDIATIDEDGYVKIVDRKKDMINVSGFKVFPNEVEDVLCEHPDIVEAAVVGVEDEESGEVVKAFVVCSNSELTEKEIRSFARESLTGYKVPHYVEFRDELPKTNVGKVLRRKLKE